MDHCMLCRVPVHGSPALSSLVLLQCLAPNTGSSVTDRSYVYNVDLTLSSLLDNAFQYPYLHKTVVPKWVHIIFQEEKTMHCAYSYD